MEANNIQWLPKKEALPEEFVTKLLGYLSPSDKGALAETHEDWARRIIRGNEHLHLVRVESETVVEWVAQQLNGWRELALNLMEKFEKQTDELCAIATVCGATSLWLELGGADVWIIVDDDARLQAVAIAQSEPHKNTHKLDELTSAPWNLWRGDHRLKGLPHPVRGAGTLLVAAIAREANRPLELVPLKDAIPFYQRCGFEKTEPLYHRLTPERARARLGHLNIKKLDEDALIARLTPSEKPNIKAECPQYK